MRNRLIALGVVLLAATAAIAQPYRWVDEKGRVQFSDTPPPKAKPARPGAAKPAPVAPAAPAAAPSPDDNAQLPFEIQRAQKDFPVTLFTAPICKQPCELAREALNKRGIPFAEVQVWNTETLEQLKTRAGSDNVPALSVGRSTISGFDQARYDQLLDSAGYPAAGRAPARSQKAPPPPEGYEPPPVAEPAKPAAEAPAGRVGPYDPSGLKDDRPPRAGRYDPSGLKDDRPPRTGSYGLPDAAK